MWFKLVSYCTKRFQMQVSKEKTIIKKKVNKRQLLSKEQKDNVNTSKNAEAIPSTSMKVQNELLGADGLKWEYLTSLVSRREKITYQVKGHNGVRYTQQVVSLNWKQPSEKSLAPKYCVICFLGSGSMIIAVSWKTESIFVYYRVYLNTTS